MRKFLALVALALFATGCMPAEVGAAAAPTVTKAWRVYSSYRYTVAADHGTITASPTQGDPVVSGGCRLAWHRNARGRVIVDGATCSSTGTVTFTSPDFPACDTPFTISVDAAPVFTDLLNSPCPPPLPPVPTIVITGSQVVFTNPASVTQTASYGSTVPALACYWTADGTFTTQTSTRFAGIGLNRRSYFYADLSVTLPPLATVTATLVCP